MESKRLLFKEITASDADKIVEWRSDYETYKYFLSPHKITIEEHLKWYENSYLFNPDRVDYIAQKKGTNESVGVFGLIFSGETVEVNYLLSKEFRGEGFASEAVSFLINFARETRHIKKAVAEVHKDNIPSLALVDRMGFKESRRDGNIIVFEKDL